MVQKLLGAGGSASLTCGRSYPAPHCGPRGSAGIDVNMVDQKGLTALDVVKEMPSQKSREIAALIRGERGRGRGRGTSPDDAFGGDVDPRWSCLFACRRSRDRKASGPGPAASSRPSAPGEPQAAQEE